MSEGNAEREPAGEILSERSESKELLLVEPLCGRERGAVEREPPAAPLLGREFAGEILGADLARSTLWLLVAFYTAPQQCFPARDKYQGTTSVGPIQSEDNRL